MAHEIAKLLLEHAGSFLQRTEAIRTALSLGMPLAEIREYLDWIDSTRPASGDSDAASDEGDRPRKPSPPR